jgi:hypothetical protein
MGGCVKKGKRGYQRHPSRSRVNEDANEAWIQFLHTEGKKAYEGGAQTLDLTAYLPRSHVAWVMRQEHAGKKMVDIELPRTLKRLKDFQWGPPFCEDHPVEDTAVMAGERVLHLLASCLHEEAHRVLNAFSNWKEAPHQFLTHLKLPTLYMRRHHRKLAKIAVSSFCLPVDPKKLADKFKGFEKRKDGYIWIPVGTHLQTSTSKRVQTLLTLHQLILWLCMGPGEVHHDHGGSNKKVEVAHTCSFKRCMNVEHMLTVPHSTNMAMTSKDATKQTKAINDAIAMRRESLDSSNLGSPPTLK